MLALPVGMSNVGRGRAPSMKTWQWLRHNFQKHPKPTSDLTFCKLNYLKCSISQNSMLEEFSKNKSDELNFSITELGILKITVLKFVIIIGSGTKQISVEWKQEVKRYRFASWWCLMKKTKRAHPNTLTQDELTCQSPLLHMRRC